MKRVVFLLATILLNGCSPWPAIDQNMQSMRGQPINMLFVRLGYPTSEGNVAGEHFYIWSNGGSVYIPDVSTTNGFGAVGGQSFNYSQTTFGGGSVAQIHCTMRVFVDKDGLITHYDGSGNNGACEQYANRLKQSAPLPALSTKASQAQEKARVAMVTFSKECKNKRLSGELKTHVQFERCFDTHLLQEHQDAGYPYMDIMEHYTEERMEIAKKLDSNEISEKQANEAIHELNLKMNEMEKERDKGN